MHILKEVFFTFLNEFQLDNYFCKISDKSNFSTYRHESPVLLPPVTITTYYHHSNASVYHSNVCNG